jgi:hypothetical protein
MRHCFNERLHEVLELVREVYQAPLVGKERSSANKKSQHLLKSLLKNIFPSAGIAIFAIIAID